MRNFKVNVIKTKSSHFPKWEPFKPKHRKFRESGAPNEIERKFTAIFENLCIGLDILNRGCQFFFPKIPENAYPFTLEICGNSNRNFRSDGRASLVPRNRITKLELTVFLRKNCVWLLCSFSSEGCPFSFSTMNWIYGSLRVWEWGVKSFSIYTSALCCATFFQRKIAFRNHELRHRLSHRS